MDADYQHLKAFLLAHFPLTKDAFHVYIGFGCLLLSVFVLRLPPSAWRSLALGVVVSLGMELLDLRDNVRYLDATSRWLGSAKDVVNTNAIPVLTVLLVRYHERRGRGRARKKA